MGCQPQMVIGCQPQAAPQAQLQQVAQVFPKGVEVMHIGEPGNKANQQEELAKTLAGTKGCAHLLRGGGYCQPQPIMAPDPYEPPNPLPDVRVEMNKEGAPGGATMTGERDPGSTDDVSLWDQNPNLPPGVKMPGQMPVHMNVKHSLRGLPNLPGQQQVWVNPGNPGGKPNIMTNYQGGIQQSIGIPGTDGNPGVQIHGISPFSDIVHVNSIRDVPQLALEGGVHAVTMPVANQSPETMQQAQAQGGMNQHQQLPEFPNAMMGGAQIKQEPGEER